MLRNGNIKKKQKQSLSTYVLAIANKPHLEVPFMRITFTTICCITFLLAGCSEKPIEETDDELESVPSKESQHKVLAKNLEEPWEIQLVNETFYVSERTGAIVTVKNGEQSRKAVNFEQDISNQPEAGLLGMALPADFTETKLALAYYSYQENGEYYQRVIRIKETEDNWEEVEVLLDKIPGGKFHQGGRIAIGPDDMLYITTGDATVPENAQSLDSLSGKILRMNLDGTIPNDNPFENSYVFTYGHRNPQGLAWDKEGNMYATEHGSSAFDEINHIQKGSNYGWPVIRGDETKKGMKTPIVHSGESTWAPSGMAFLEGDFYFASLRGEGVRRFNPDKKEVELIVDGVGRVRDVLATDKGIYFITNNTDGRGSSEKDDDRLLFISK